jgi:hypothetical protein
MDPLPIERHAISKHEKYGTIAGWGANKALTADTSVVEGAYIKRSATVRLLGSPTEADYHADDPNPGILDAAIRKDLIKTDGRAPRSNTCAGDSGGPLLVDQHGRDRVAAVSFWGGLWCEDYSMFTRVAPFVDFIDDQAERAGKADIIPRLDCVNEADDGSLTAYFGYRNDNGVTVEVPYGYRNFFPKDSDHARPESFAQGDNGFAFGIDIDAGETLKWKLKAGTTTVVEASASSPRCDPADPTLLCSTSCDNQLASECADGTASRSTCVVDCKVNSDFFTYVGCGAEWGNYLACIAEVPSAPENWDCSYPGIPPSPISPNCDAEVAEAIGCLYGY